MVFQAIPLKPLGWAGKAVGVRFRRQGSNGVAKDGKTTIILPEGANVAADALASFRETALILSASRIGSQRR